MVGWLYSGFPFVKWHGLNGIASSELCPDN